MRSIFPLLFSVFAPFAAAQHPATGGASTGSTAPAASLTNQYCLGCHNKKAATAGIAFDGLDPTNAGRNAAKWEKVLRKLRTGEMPPPGLPRPNPTVSAAFTAS